VFKHILVPLDGSYYAEMALAYAQNLAQATGAHLTLLTVVPHLQINVEASQMRQMEEWNRRLALDYLKPIHERLLGAGINADYRVVIGEPAQTISDLAEQEAVDIIAMSSRGIRSKGPYIVGSTALKVLQTAPCPTIVLRITEPTEPPAPQ